MFESKSNRANPEQLRVEQLKSIANNFSQELQDANSGKKTSLAFIIHKLSPSPIVKSGETFLSLVIGGTVGKIATLRKTGNAIQILSKKEEKLSLKSEEEFLDFIETRIPNNINAVALNFAYALEPVFEKEKLDGILLKVAKEGKLRGLIGKKIGQEIENYVLEKRNKKIKVAVANDTVCLLTSGLNNFQKQEIAGGIVGTGLNFSFFTDENHLTNLEAANFNKFAQTSEGKIIDHESDIPGEALFEKETAGAYLYRHFNMILKENQISYHNIASTEELDKISRANIPHVSEIARDLLKRSAQLVACQIAGITLFKKLPMVFNMEGSLFWKGNNYKRNVEETVKELIPEYKVRFVEIKNSAILGAAKLIS